MLSVRRFVLAALAVSTVSASCPQQSDVKIESDGDVKKYFDSTCSKYDGSITLGKNVLSVEFPDLVSITGDFVCDSAVNLISISASQLKSIGQNFQLNRLTSLKKLDFPALLAVGKISWQTLPALESLDFTSYVTKSEEVWITDTILTSLQGINVTEVQSFLINNNRFLRQIDIPLQHVSDTLDINSNGKALKVSFPDLEWANNITIRDAASVTFPSLSRVNGSASFISNSFDSIEFPKLTEVDGSFSFAKCGSLTNITANSVKIIDGTFLIANNTKLSTVDGLTKLSKVGGSVDMAGKFEKVSLPSLDDVRGSFNLQSTESLDCSPFDKLQSDEVVKGEYICEDKKQKASSLTEDGLDTIGSGSGKEPDSAAGRVTVSILLSAVAVMVSLAIL